MIKKFAKGLLKNLNLYSLYSLKKSGPLYEDGWFRSVEENRCVDLYGNPVPWFTYPAIDFLVKRIHPDMTVFEYGCGGSTLWWASRVKKVISVEHDKSWYDKISRHIPANVSLIYADLEIDGAYSEKAAEYGQEFNIIVIDGRDRVNCALKSLKALKPDGVIIWDNSDRKDYEEGYRFLFDQGFKKIEFVGMAPIVNMKVETGIFYRPENCLNI